MLAYRDVRKTRPDLRMIIIDLDVHQVRICRVCGDDAKGNGHERDKLKFHKDDVYIIDAYNPYIFPGELRLLLVPVRGGVAPMEQALCDCSMMQRFCFIFLP